MTLLAELLYTRSLLKYCKKTNCFFVVVVVFFCHYLSAINNTEL